MPQLTAQQRAALRAQFRPNADPDALIDAIVEAVTGEPDTIEYHALNYRSAANLQQASEALKKLHDVVERKIAQALRDRPAEKVAVPAPVRVAAQVLLDGRVIHTTPATRVYDGDTVHVYLTEKP